MREGGRKGGREVLGWFGQRRKRKRKMGRSRMCIVYCFYRDVHSEAGLDLGAWRWMMEIEMEVESGDGD